MTLPERPRLTAVAAARRHRSGSTELVVLHDPPRDAMAGLGPREWTILQACDGTRDLEGILAYARQRGLVVGRADLRAFLEGLGRLGAFRDATRVPAAEPPLGPVRPIEGWGLACDGRGHCCEAYETVIFDPVEAARARGLEGDAPLPTPAFGLDEGTLAGPLRDGACHFLDETRRCRIHGALGAEAKPRGCRLFPLSAVHDGEAVRLFPAPECACVFDLRDRGAPIPSVLPDGLVVEPLPARWGEHAVGDVLSWLADAPGGDAVEVLLRLADGAARLEHPAPRPRPLRTQGLRRTLAHRRAQHAWRAPGDRIRADLDRVAGALDGWDGRPDPAPRPEEEEAYLELLFFGHLLRDAEDLSEALERAALRVALARRWPTAGHALAEVTALCRARALL
jgi:lysine-N-methylase